MSLAFRFSQFYETYDVEDIYKRLLVQNQYGKMDATRMGVSLTPELRVSYYFEIDNMTFSPIFIYLLPQILDASDYETRQADPSTYTFSDQRYYIGLNVWLKM